MDDLISRQAAIDAINSGMLTDDDTQFECPSECNSMLEWAVNAVKELPTAEKKGKWEIDADCEYDIFDIAGERTWAVKATCSECGFAMRFIEEHGVFNYCPNCGARMEE